MKQERLNTIPRGDLMKYLIEAKSKGSLSDWLKKMMNVDPSSELHQIGIKGVGNLYNETPKLTGELAIGWTYEVIKEGKGHSLYFINQSHPETPQPLALLIYYGHGTGTGGYVPGRDYITPALGELLSQSTMDFIVRGMTKNG